MIPIGSIGYQELMIIAVIAVILFGGRLPEVARSLGQTYQQFRKGLSELQSSFNSDSGADFSSNPTKPTGLPYYSDVDDESAESAPQFEPPPRESDDSPSAT